MIFAVGVSLLGGLLATKRTRLRQPVKLTLLDRLGDPAEPMISSPSTLPLVVSTPKLWTRFDQIRVEQHLVLSTSILGLTILSPFALPFLRFLPMVGLLYLNIYFLRRAYKEWRTVGLGGVTDAIVATGLLITRQVGAGALFATIYFVSHKLVERTQTTLAQQESHPPQSTASIELTATEEGEDHPPSSVAQPRVSSQLGWQKIIRQGALPFLTLSAITMPFFGFKQALAVLVTNFVYDYRVTAPLSTLTYIDLAAEHEIVIIDWRAFEQLHQVDVLLLDEQLFTGPVVDRTEEMVPPEQATHWRILHELQQAGRECFILQTITVPAGVVQTDLAETIVPPANVTTVTLHEASVLIPKLQASGRTVGLVCCTPLAVAITSLADVVIHMQPTNQTSIVQLTSEGIHIVIPTGHLGQVLALLQLAEQLDHNLKRGFAIALLPSLLSLSEIYFFHFGVFIPLLLDGSGLAVGVLNAQLPRLGRRSTPPEKRTIDLIPAANYPPIDSTQLSAKLE